MGGGISLTSSSSLIVANNTCYNNKEYGISLDNSDFSTVINNTCNHSRIYTAEGVGFSFTSSSSLVVTNNTCNVIGGRGIFLDEVNTSIVVNNIFLNSGLKLGQFSKEDLLSNTVENNTVNDLPLGYLENQTELTITDSYGQLILINCTKVIVKNQNCSNTTIGIALYYCQESQLVNNSFNNNRNGIFIDSSNSMDVVKNICNNNGGGGIIFHYSNFSIVTDNICTSNGGTGIYFGDSNSSTVTNNAITNNEGNGIHLEDSGSSIVANNYCNNNEWKAIALYDSSSSIVKNNICYKKHPGWGISIVDSSSSSVVNNTLYNMGLDIRTYPTSKEELLSHVVENNSVNDLPLGYFENQTELSITESYGQLILINCTKAIVKNQNCSNTTIGIALYYCQESQVINNTCEYNIKDGIRLELSNGSTLANNICNNNGNYGIFLSKSYSSTIINNFCNNNGNGEIYSDEFLKSDFRGDFRTPSTRRIYFRL